jgi:mRNA interferase YafQ
LNPQPKPPLIPARTTAFGRDVARCRARGYDMDALRVTMGRLIHRQHLERTQKDHALKGKWIGYRECHLADDWLLVYRIIGNEIFFARTGNHTDIFEA